MNEILSSWVKIRGIKSESYENGSYWRKIHRYLEQIWYLPYSWNEKRARLVYKPSYYNVFVHYCLNCSIGFLTLLNLPLSPKWQESNFRNVPNDLVNLWIGWSLFAVNQAIYFHETTATIFSQFINDSLEFLMSSKQTGERRGENMTF